MQYYCPVHIRQDKKCQNLVKHQFKQKRYLEKELAWEICGSTYAEIYRFVDKGPKGCGQAFCVVIWEEKKRAKAKHFLDDSLWNLAVTQKPGSEPLRTTEGEYSETISYASGSYILSRYYSDIHDGASTALAHHQIHKRVKEARRGISID